METHCSLENSLMLEGFRSVHLIRSKSKGTNKRSGGISVFVKTQLRTGVKFLEHQNNDYIWLKLCKSFFGLKDDIYMYICFIYKPPPPLSTPHTQENFKMIFLRLLRKIYLNTQMTGK